MRLIFPALIALVTMVPDTAAAEEAPRDPRPHDPVNIGARVAPEQQGSDELRFAALFLADTRWGSLMLEVRGLRARVVPASDTRFFVAPFIGVRDDRGEVEGPIRRSPERSLAIEAGGYVGYRFGGDRPGQGSVRVELAVAYDSSRARNGQSTPARQGPVAVRQTESSMSFNLKTAWVDGDDARADFGISSRDAAISGPTANDPGSGSRDFGGRTSADHYFNRRPEIVDPVGSIYLIGNPDDSEVTVQGSRWQPFAGVTLSYRF